MPAGAPTPFRKQQCLERPAIQFAVEAHARRVSLTRHFAKPSDCTRCALATVHRTCTLPRPSAQLTRCRRTVQTIRGVEIMKRPVLSLSIRHTVALLMGTATLV